MKERTGELRKKQDGSFMGRIRVDGTRTPWSDLCTRNETTAKEKLERWMETGQAPSQAPLELFKDAALRFMKKMRAKPGSKPKACNDREHRLEQFVLPMLGEMQVGRVETKDIARVLDAHAAQGYSKSSCNSLAADMSRVFALVRRDGGVSENPVTDVGLPEDAPIDSREPIILDDHEIIAFRKRGFDSELDMMVLFCCELGGHRTSDLHAASWTDTDTFNFQWITVRRPKTTDQAGRLLEERRRRERPSAGERRATRAFERVKHKLKGTVRDALIAWWKKAGCPRSGPIFPVQRGPRLGLHKGDNISYAQAFRDALWEEGIVRPMEGYELARGEDRRKFCQLQTATADTRPVDFHSLRRWFATRLANAGINEQDAMDLTGHSVASTHARYRGPRLVEVPDHALLPDGQGPASPAQADPPPAPGGPVPPAPQAGLDPAAIAAAVAGAVAQALAGHALTTPARQPSVKPPIDPESGAMRPRTELRAIKGGKE